MKTLLLTAGDTDTAARLLREGSLVGIPTETVYGLGADGTNEQAVEKIFKAKGRPQDNPLILHIPDAGWLERCCREIPAEARTLAERFWPGPLTMILKRREEIPDAVTAGLDTVGVRCPAHPVCREIIRSAGVPVAAPSGNLSGRPSPTTAAHMMRDMDGRIDALVDGGPCQVGVESTIVDLTCSPPVLLRPGGIPLESLRGVLGEVLVDPAVEGRADPGAAPRAPGMKYRHYAPRAPLTLVCGRGEDTAAYIAAHAPEKCGVLCFREFAGCFPGRQVVSLGGENEPEEQARRLFDALRAFDNTDVGEIWAQSPQEQGVGRAVVNRLNRASGFHVIRV